MRISLAQIRNIYKHIYKCNTCFTEIKGSVYDVSMTYTDITWDLVTIIVANHGFKFGVVVKLKLTGTLEHRIRESLGLTA